MLWVHTHKHYNSKVITSLSLSLSFFFPFNFGDSNYLLLEIKEETKGKGTLIKEQEKAPQKVSSKKNKKYALCYLDSDPSVRRFGYMSKCQTRIFSRIFEDFLCNLKCQVSYPYPSVKGRTRVRQGETKGPGNIEYAQSPHLHNQNFPTKKRRKTKP